MHPRFEYDIAKHWTDNMSSIIGVNSIFFECEFSGGKKGHLQITPVNGSLEMHTIFTGMDFISSKNIELSCDITDLTITIYDEVEEWEQQHDEVMNNLDWLLELEGDCVDR